MDINGFKNILITLHSFIDLAGAEINALSLAEEFLSQGCTVTIGTFKYGYPIMRLCENKNIRVVNIIAERINSEEFDLIWSHHAPSLYHLIFNHKINAKKIVFSSLSPFEPLEFPPYFINELNMCLANSQETKRQLIQEQVEEQLIRVFPNYATRDFFQYKKKLSVENKINRLAVVSNHVPSEVIDAVTALTEEGIVTDLYGINHKEEFITPEILNEYDAVISIGKTVQYCLVMGIPVFCYDVHGGPGWIDKTNYEVAKFHNFSGRGFNSRLQSIEIVEIIKNKYGNGIRDIESLSIAARKEFNLSRNLNEVLETLSKDRDINVDEINKKSQHLQREHQAFMREYEYNYFRMQELDKNARLLNEYKNKLEHNENEMRIREDRIQLIEEELKENEEVLVNFKHNEDNNVALINKLQKNEQAINDEVMNLKVSLAHLNKDLDVAYKLIKEKDNNCMYLSELTKEKVNLIEKMENTKMWMYSEKLRKLRNKVIKVVRDPKIVLRKLSKNSNKFAKSVVLSSDIIQEKQYSSELLVSIVIPIYDRTDVLITSIESILNQSYQNIELLLVCDGSPKETVDIVKSYEDHPKVRTFYFYNNSGNAVRGRNKAIREAKGEYLAFQDSDDIADVDRIKISVEAIESNQVDVVYGGWRALVDGTRKIELDNNQEVFSPDCDYEFLKQICVPCQSTVMVRLAALRFVGGLKPIMKYREDHELWLRLAYYGFKFKSINKVLTNLRLHENNLELSFKDDDKKWENLTLSEHKVIRPMKPKIAYIIAGTGISGGLAVIAQHANGLLDRGYDVIMISEDGNKTIDWLPNQKVEILSLDEVPNNLDVLIATYWTTAYTAQHIPAKKKCYFVQSDESKFFEVGTVESKAALESYKLGYTLITMAKWLQDWLKTSFNQNAIYVPNGVDSKVIYQVEPLLAKGEKLRVLLEGPIDVPFKNMEAAFSVVNDLDCEIWCVSSAGKPKDTWRCDMFFDSVPMEKMKSIYSSCDVLLKMSSVESFCLPALEMMKCGGVPVLNRFNGLEEFAIHNYNSLIVEKGDIQAAREAIQQLVNDRELLKRLSDNGVKTANEWNWDKSIDILDDFFLVDK